MVKALSGELCVVIVKSRSHFFTIIYYTLPLMLGSHLGIDIHTMRKTMTKKPFVFWLALGIILAATASPCLGAEAEDDSSFSIRASGRYMSDGDVGDGDGSVAFTSEDLRLQWSMFSLTYSQAQFQWDNIGSLSFGNGVDDPWKRLHRLAFGVEYGGEINDDWFYHTGLTLTSSFEKEMAGSYGGALRGGLGYKLTENVSLLGGIAVMHNPVRTMIAPTLVLEYDGVDQSGAGWTGSIGFPMASLGYQFDTISAVRFNFESTGRTARLADDSTVARKGYVDTSGWQTALYYDWTPSENVRLSLGPEYTFGRTLDIYNNDGNKLKDENVDAAWGGSLRFRYSF